MQTGTWQKLSQRLLLEFHVIPWRHDGLEYVSWFADNWNILATSILLKPMNMLETLPVIRLTSAWPISTNRVPSTQLLEIAFQREPFLVRKSRRKNAF